MRQAAEIFHGRNFENGSAGGTHLPPSLRGGWSIVVPWIGFSFERAGEILRSRIQTQNSWRSKRYYDPAQMPLGSRSGLHLPYVEGLRMDEAMHPLTMITVGMYGETLPNQDGAPVRVTIPWKYGFKSIKSIVKVRFVKDMPPTTWNISAPDEYGFYSNVNPEVDHPRWSQAKERRLGEFGARPTVKLMATEIRWPVSTTEWI